MGSRGLAASAAIAVLAAVMAAVMAGCTEPTEGTVEDSAAEVSVDAATATVGAGETLRVDFGWINPSIGDSWHLVGEPDSGVLAEIGKDHTTSPDCEEGHAGCDVELVWEFEAVAEGETELEFQYCYRSGPDDCDGEGGDAPAPEPVTLTVEVTE